MNKILIINGPNLNLLGLRKPDVYGTLTLSELSAELDRFCIGTSCTLEHFQSNHEGAILDKLHSTIHSNRYLGCVINAGALTHYSYAIRDAIEAIPLPCIEVHLSDIENREPFRKLSVLSEVCLKQIKGKGISGYKDAIEFLMNL